MDQHGGNYFTLWYGVYQMSMRTLCYASAGHLPAIENTGPAVDPVRLSSLGLPSVCSPHRVYPRGVPQVPDDAEIVLYSDGARSFRYPKAHHGR